MSVNYKKAAPPILGVLIKKKKREIYQEVCGRRHGDPVVKQFSCVVVHQSTLFHRLKETQSQ